MKLSEEMLAYLASSEGDVSATRRWLPLVRELEAGTPSRSEVQAFARCLTWLLGIEVGADTIAVHVERGEEAATITIDVDEQHLSCVVQRTKRPESSQPLQVNDWGYWA